MSSVSDVQTCAFCGSPHLHAIKTLQRTALLEKYEKTLQLTLPDDVVRSNFEFDALSMLKCAECGTISFAPTAVGDEAYYAFLSSKLTWYYDPVRWEYDKALDVFARNDVKSFLEIGCGDGHFLRLARMHGYTGTGSELNSKSAEQLRDEGFEVLSPTETAIGGRTYDSLVTFQVLEHVAEPRSFLASHLRLLRPGGLILISTPVTPSCATSLAWHVLRLPPHHQTLPTAAGHARLAERLGCTCEEVMFDPANPQEVESSIGTYIGWLPFFERYSGRLARLVMWIARRLGANWAEVGHTILVVLRLPRESQAA